jgi:hypothetical protein
MIKYDQIGICEHGYSAMIKVNGSRYFLCEMCQTKWNLKSKRLLLIRKKK